MIFDKLYLVKIGPIFDDSQLSCVTFHYKILSVCSLDWKNLLNFIWKPANFHNRHHTNTGYVYKDSFLSLALNWTRKYSLGGTL